MSFQKFCNVREAAKVYRDHGAVAREVRIGRDILEWVERAAEQARTYPAPVLNDAVLVGSVRALASQYGLQRYLKPRDDTSEAEIPSRVRYEETNDTERIRFSISAFANYFAEQALIDTETPLEDIVLNGTRTLGRMACYPNSSLVISEFSIHPVRLLSGGQETVEENWWPIPLLVDYTNVDPLPGTEA